MKRITLFRHAKSSWKDSEQSDHDRPLNDRGNRDAPRMAKRLLRHNCVPDHILCSSALRTRQTARHLVENMGISSDAVHFSEKMYLAQPGTLLELIQSTPARYEHVMLIGHNPGMEMLGRQLHPSAPTAMATCAVLHFEIDGDNFILDTHKSIELKFHEYPKKPD